MNSITGKHYIDQIVNLSRRTTKPLRMALICLGGRLSLYVLVATNIPAVTEGTSREVVPDPGDTLTFEISLFDQNMLLKGRKKRTPNNRNRSNCC